MRVDLEDVVDRVAGVVHLVLLQGHVTGRGSLMIMLKLIPRSVSKRRVAPWLSGQCWGQRVDLDRVAGVVERVE